MFWTRIIEILIPVAFGKTKRFTSLSFFDFVSRNPRNIIREILFRPWFVAKVYKNGDNFSQSRPRCWKSVQIKQRTDELSAKKGNERQRDISHSRKCKARPSLCGNGILSSSADGPLISATAMFPKCFVSCRFEPYSPSPRVYRDCHCLFKQFAVINPERFLRKLWP